MKLQRCGHCHRIMGDEAGGWASYNGIKVCHPTDPDRPDCYRMISHNHHEVEDCEECCDEESRRSWLLGK